MTGRKEFEAMLEALINEDREAARDIFHNIVVAKSRQIYETLLAEDFDLYEKDEDSEESKMGDMDIDDEEDSEESEMGDMDIDDEEDSEESEMGDMDIDDEEGDGDLEDRVLDLEDALEELKAEFEELMADQEGGEEDEFSDEEDEFGDESDLDSDEDEFGEPGLGDMDLGDEDEFGKPSAGGMGSSGGMDRSKPMYEYVNKVSPPKHGDNGVNSKSPVAKPNRMGGTSANIVKGGESKGGGTKGGLLAPNAKVDDQGNQNKPGARVKGYTNKVATPKSKETADRGAQSPINGVKSRAK